MDKLAAGFQLKMLHTLESMYARMPSSLKAPCSL